MSNTPLEQNGIDLTEVLEKVNALPSGGITPSGSITLTEERSYDVTDKATAVVDMSATRANLAEAVTAKGVDTLPTSSFDTIATNIGLISGDGGLPSVISKIDGGSFTVESNTKCDAYSIAHNLGTIPKGFYVWTDDETSATAVDIYALIYSQFLTLTHDTQSGTSNSGCLMQYYRITTGKTASATRTPTAAQLSGYVTNTQFKINNSAINYRAGNTYKWLAWA